MENFFKKDVLEAMEVGEVFRGPGLLAGLDPDEPMLYILTETNLKKTDFVFDMVYYDVVVGSVAATIRGSVVIVEDL